MNLPRTLRGASEGLARGEFTSEELVTASLKMAEARADLNAFITMVPERALERARDIDRRRASGEALGPMAGVPVGIKDNMCTEGVRTTCGSRILESFVPPYTATAVSRLEAQGAVMIGKANLDEFAMGSSNENSAFGPVRHPEASDRIPGGSSGGSASLVAAGIAPVALGSDTGGSIRQPASLCGVVGLKPTYGRVSRYGLVAYASSLDQIGPMTNSVEDCAIVLQAIAGEDVRDNTASRLPVPDYLAEMKGGIKGLRVGIPAEYWGEGLDAGVREVLVASVERLRQAGAVTVPVSLPSTRYAISAYYVVATAEASSNLARYDGVRYSSRAEDAANLLELYGKTRTEFFGREVRRRILVGTFVLSAGYYDAYYSKAQRVRTVIRREFDEAFAKCDVLATPASPTTAFRLGEKTEDPLAMYLSDIDTIAVNLAGVPALVVPAGRSGGLPVGLQFIGPAFAEGTLFRAGRAVEEATPT